MATKIQLRRDTAANWTSNNPTLSSGEFGVETDTGKAKVGNGSTAWASLAYMAGGGEESEASNYVHEIYCDLCIEYTDNETDWVAIYEDLAYTLDEEDPLKEFVLLTGVVDPLQDNGVYRLNSAGELTPELIGETPWPMVVYVGLYKAYSSDSMHDSGYAFYFRKGYNISARYEEGDHPSWLNLNIYTPDFEMPSIYTDEVDVAHWMDYFPSWEAADSPSEPSLHSWMVTAYNKINSISGIRVIQNAILVDSGGAGTYNPLYSAYAGRVFVLSDSTAAPGVYVSSGTSILFGSDIFVNGDEFKETTFIRCTGDYSFPSIPTIFVFPGGAKLSEINLNDYMIEDHYALPMFPNVGSGGPPWVLKATLDSGSGLWSTNWVQEAV